MEGDVEIRGSQDGLGHDEGRAEKKRWSAPKAVRLDPRTAQNGGANPGDTLTNSSTASA
jgi:hypothetical protein